MKAELSFSVTLPYLQSEFDKVRTLGTRTGRVGPGQYIWTFPLRNLEELMKILSKTIEFNSDDIELARKYAPPTKAQVDVPAWKGKDKMEVIELPNEFKIVTHRKIEADNEAGFKIKEISKLIPKPAVNLVWNVVRHQQKNSPVSTETVSKNIVEEAGIDRFHRRSGSFDFDKFFGARHDYFSHFYYPIKVLQFYGVIKHHRSGKVEKLKDSWTIRTTLRTAR